MQFWQHQSQARKQTVRLLLWFLVLVVVLVLVINGVLALAFKLVMPFYPGWPRLFFETNTGVALLFILGGCWVETMRLRDGGGVRVAHWMGGVEVLDTGDALNRRLLNVVDEMALASGQPIPRVFVLPKEDAINAFVAGWSAQTSALCVTRGALERLTRAELQGLVAHEFGHLAEGDGRLGMRLLALVWGLSLIHGWGSSLMQPDVRGRVHPLSWAVGAAIAAVGWLGWLTGRLLQSAVSRQREFLADARAVQFTRSRDGLGQVLRKVWHEQQSATAHLHHPHADMLSFMWLTAGGWTASWLASHPPLIDRIRRVYGVPRSPLPSSAGRYDEEPLSLEPRHVPVAMAPPQKESTRVSPPRLLPEADTAEILGRLHRLASPLQRRMALLAFLMRPGNEAEQRLWDQAARELHGASTILADVQGLPPVWRVPEFERQLAQMAYENVEQRRALVVATRELMRADGKVSARDRLWWLALRHRMGEITARHAFIRPVTGQGRDLVQLSDDERVHVQQFTAYLARLLPVESVGVMPTPEGVAWFRSVMARCQLGSPADTDCVPPDADALMHALAGVQELSWMMRPQLVRAWVEEALNHSAGGLLSPDTADALRLAAGLLDTPLPPALAAHYPKA